MSHIPTPSKATLCASAPDKEQQLFKLPTSYAAVQPLPGPLITLLQNKPPHRQRRASTTARSSSPIYRTCQAHHCTPVQQHPYQQHTHQRVGQHGKSRRVFGLCNQAWQHFIMLLGMNRTSCCFLYGSVWDQAQLVATLPWLWCLPLAPGLLRLFKALC